MDEDIYRQVYHQINKNRCIFEKALTNRRCDCEQKQRFNLATREAMGCRSVAALANCTEYLNTMREKARFALRVTLIDGPMPHNKELQVQAGGCLQLQKQLFPERADHQTTDNIYELVNAALLEFAAIDNFPYGEMVKGIVTYQSRKRKRR